MRKFVRNLRIIIHQVSVDYHLVQVESKQQRNEECGPGRQNLDGNY